MRFKRRVNLFLKVTCILLIVYVVYQYTSTTQKDNDNDRSTSWLPNEKTPIELTIRMPLQKRMITNFFCDLMRSAVLFWNKDYGDIVVILDEEDNLDTTFPKALKSLPYFKFRFVYEKSPNKVFIEKAARQTGRHFGYYRMFYSSFLMDLYTSPNTIIAWADSDISFTMPVIRQTIFRNGKLIVKGANTDFEWSKHWARTTSLALGGIPMIADFMTFFPVYLFPSTIRNCREYILKVFNVKTIEEAISKFTVAMVSPVCIILSYAYHFERHLYEFHIDLLGTSLEHFNKVRAIEGHTLTHEETFPEIHQSVHTRYYIPENGHVLRQAACYTFFSIGDEDRPECDVFKNKVNLQLFEFQTQLTHVKSWCGGEKLPSCSRLIKSAYDLFYEQYKQKKMIFETKGIQLVEKLALSKYDIECKNHEIDL